MSSAANLIFEPDTIGVPADQWETFCAEHGIQHRPQTVGGNVYYAEAVEIHYERHHVRFSTYWRGGAMPNVARLAALAWARWGGRLSADEEIRQRIVAKAVTP